jgi:hypothetical protein
MWESIITFVLFISHATRFGSSHLIVQQETVTTFLHKMDFCDDQAGIEIHKEMFMKPVSVSVFLL